MSREELDEERWFEEEAADMEARVDDLEDEIEEADRAAPPHPGPDDERAGD